MTHQTSINKGRVLQFSYMKVMACAAIILLHSLFASNVYYQQTMSPGDLLWSKLLQNLLMWAVPLFIMVTGSLLLDPTRKISLNKVWGKYIKRMILALVIFTFLFRICQIAMEGQAVTLGTVVGISIKQIVTSTGWAHMWYLYMMIALYALLPFYKLIAEHADEKLLGYLVLIYGIFMSVLPLTGIFGWEDGFYLCTTIIYPIYLFLGYMIHHGKLMIEKPLAIILVIGCSLVLVLFTIFRYNIGDSLMNEQELKVFDKLFGYSSPFVIGQVMGIFALMDRMRPEEGPILRMMQSIDGCSFGIYLIHMIFVRLILKAIGFDPYSMGMLWGIVSFLGMTIAFFLLSYLTTWVLKKIPGVSGLL